MRNLSSDIDYGRGFARANTEFESDNVVSPVAGAKHGLQTNQGRRIFSMMMLGGNTDSLHTPV